MDTNYGRCPYCIRCGMRLYDSWSECSSCKEEDELKAKRILRITEENLNAQELRHRGRKTFIL